MRVSRRHFVELAGLGVAGSTLRGARAATESDVAHDPLRPAYHLMPPHNWMNDPNGPIWWKGKYHLFYQLNPHAAIWGDMHWGHAVSADMVHWRHEPIALAPTPGGPDSEGCFSGSAVVDNGVPTFIYTGVQAASSSQATIHSYKWRETQLLATAEDDDLLRWKKRAEPIIALPPPGMAVTGFRDPCPWREGDTWYLALGSGERGKGGCVLLYRSQDLRQWEYLHKLAEGHPGSDAKDPVGGGDMWECPDFFALDDRHCLLYSTQGKVIWATGHYDAAAHRFTAEHEGVLDHGAYYAPKSFLAPDGRRILWGWIQETRAQAEYAAAGWAGAMSLPRVLGVDADGRLTMTPAVEVDSLRETPVMASHDGAMRSWTMHQLRCELDLHVEKSATVRLRTRGTAVWELHVDTAAGTVRCGETSFAIGRAAKSNALRVFLDGSVLESFFSDGEALTSRVYTLEPGATEFELEAGDTTKAELRKLQAISPNRLTR